MDLKDGKTFSAFEKRAILPAINDARIYYQAATTQNTDDLYTSCLLLCDSIQNFFMKCAQEHPLSDDPYFLGTDLYMKLHNKYHNSDFYNQNGLPANDSLFWWPTDDIKSRLKALDILEQAIIND